MGQLWRMSCRESFASKGDGQGQGPGPGEEGRSGQDGRRKGRDWRRGCRGRQEWGRVWIYSRSLENFWIFQAGRCHDPISPFLFKIPLGPACRIGWTEEGAESDMGLNDLMIQCQFGAHSRPSIRMLDPSGRENNAGEEERRFHLAVCSLVCPGTNFNRAKPQLPQMYNRVKNTPYLPHPGRTHRGGLRSSSLVPAPRGVLMVLLTLAGETGVAVGRGLREEARPAPISPTVL